MVLAMIVVGPQRFPEIARHAGRWFRVARRYTNEVMRDVRAAVDEIEHEINEETAELRALGDVSSDLRAVREDVEAVSDEAASDGAVSDGAASDGAVSDGAVSDGAVSDGAASDGAVSDGAVSDGAVSDGAVSDGAQPTTTGPTASVVEGTETTPPDQDAASPSVRPSKRTTER